MEKLGLPCVLREEMTMLLVRVMIRAPIEGLYNMAQSGILWAFIFNDLAFGG